MKLEIDWGAMLKAALKAIWPFLAGGLGGLLSGCTVGGIGPNFFRLGRLTLGTGVA